MTQPQTYLKEHFSDPQDYLPILETLAVVGVADTRQLLQVTGLKRDKLRRTIAGLENTGEGRPPFVQSLRQTIRRKTSRGRSPQVYQLTKGGAMALPGRERASKLKGAREISHALSMLDLHLAAKNSGLPVITDLVLKTLRPDHQITLPDGDLALFEIEQDASPETLRRVLRSLRNKADFFASSQKTSLSRQVRMLIALPAGSAYERTLHIWHQAVDILCTEWDGELPFELLALPLAAFLDQPDWDEPPDAQRWTPITPPAGEPSPAHRGELTRYLLQIPQRSPQQDRLIMAALLQHVQQQKARMFQGRVTRGSPAFFETVGTIYAASHDPELSPLTRASHPWGSIFLFQQYLHMHPELRAQLIRRMRANMQRTNWNTSIILHRMQTVVDVFLRYHGWRSDGPLLAYTETASWDVAAPRRFQVNVAIRHPEILMQTDEIIVPNPDDVRQTELALTWALNAIFCHAHELGFKIPPFW